MVIAQKVKEILDKDRYAQHAMRLGIANYSAIAKKLRKETGGSLEAVKVAVMRYAENLKKEKGYFDAAAKILKESQIALKSNASVLVFEKSPLTVRKLEKLISKGITVVDGQNYITVILDDFFAKEAKGVLGKPEMEKNNLYVLLITSPIEIEDTPGVLGFLFEKLARKGINVIEFYSCYQETALVLDKKDALDAFAAVEKLIHT